MSQPSDPGWVTFRKQIIAALERDGAFYYIDQDRVAGRCPLCGEPLGVRFIARQPAADFVCHRGCDENEARGDAGEGA